MSDTKDHEGAQDQAKGRLSLRPAGRLELGRTVDAGSVKQSFSHRRTKTVQVEARKSRPAAAVPAPPAAPPPPPSMTPIGSPTAVTNPLGLNVRPAPAAQAEARPAAAAPAAAARPATGGAARSPTGGRPLTQ